MIVVVDYGRGNLYSLAQALGHLGVEFKTTRDPDHVASAATIILPGVGAFGDAMAELSECALVEPIRDAAARGIPVLGICLGMQLLVDSSEEFGRHVGLSLVPGTVRRLPEEGPMRIPNVGWRTLHVLRGDPLVDGLEDGAMVYFVHSYAPVLADPGNAVATTPMNGVEIPAVIRRNQVVGYQFHPEKSGPAGLDLLRRFFEFAAKGR